MYTTFSKLDEMIDARASEIDNRESARIAKMISDLSKVIVTNLSTEFMGYLGTIEYKVVNDSAKAIFEYRGKSIGIIFSTTNAACLNILLGGQQVISVTDLENLQDAILDALLKVRKDAK